MSGISWGAFDPAHLVGASDPYTLSALLPGERITYCARCVLGYHAETMAFLRQQNHGQCVGCGRSDRLVAIVLPGAAATGKPPLAVIGAGDVPLVTLEKIHEHVGQVVDFEGYVHQVYRARGTGNWFVKFEQTRSPVDGFRLVIFNRYTPNWTGVGIDPFAYEGQVIRVHGLIQVHREWGIQMLIDRPSLISFVEKATPRQRIIWKAGGS